MGKDNFVKEILDVVDDIKLSATKDVIDSEYQADDLKGQCDQLFNRVEELSVELQNIKDHIEQLRDKISNCSRNEDEGGILGIGCF